MNFCACCLLIWLVTFPICTPFYWFYCSFCRFFFFVLFWNFRRWFFLSSLFDFLHRISHGLSHWWFVFSSIQRDYFLNILANKYIRNDHTDIWNSGQLFKMKKKKKKQKSSLSEKIHCWHIECFIKSRHR